MNREETFRLTQEVLTGINRVIETFHSLAPEGDALLTSETRVSDDDALFYGRVASAVSMLRACANRLMRIVQQTGMAPAKFIELQPHSPIPLPSNEEKPVRVVRGGHILKRRTPRPRGFIADWLLKKLGHSPMPMLKSDLVRLGVAAGMSDPSLYHWISRFEKTGQIKTNGEGRLYLNKDFVAESEASEQ
jgi:hypothetical protein